MAMVSPQNLSISPDIIPLCVQDIRTIYAGDSQKTYRRSLLHDCVNVFANNIHGAAARFSYNNAYSNLSQSHPNLHKKYQLYTKADILANGSAWSALKSSSNSYNIPVESQLIQQSVKEGVLNREILENKSRLIELGVGEEKAVRQNTMPFWEQFENQQTNEFYDIFKHYADKAGEIAYETYKANGKDAPSILSVTWDFMSSQKLDLHNSENARPIISIFGGTLANAWRKSAPANNTISLKEDAKNTAASYLKHIKDQFGGDSRFIITADTNSRKNEIIERYKATNEIKTFALSFLVQAQHLGMIKNDNYDIFEHWDVESVYDEDNKAVEINLVCLKDHDLYIEDHHFQFSKNDKITPILSHKWSIEDYNDIFEKAGLGIDDVYEIDGNPHSMIIASSNSTTPDRNDKTLGDGVINFPTGGAHWRLANQISMLKQSL